MIPANADSGFRIICLLKSDGFTKKSVYRIAQWSKADEIYYPIG